MQKNNETKIKFWAFILIHFYYHNQIFQVIFVQDFEKKIKETSEQKKVFEQKKLLLLRKKLVNSVILLLLFFSYHNFRQKQDRSEYYFYRFKKHY